MWYNDLPVARPIGVGAFRINIGGLERREQ